MFGTPSGGAMTAPHLQHEVRRTEETRTTSMENCCHLAATMQRHSLLKTDLEELTFSSRMLRRAFSSSRDRSTESIWLASSWTLCINTSTRQHVNTSTRQHVRT
ncbi:hypothetical protein EYF80_056395 [Liparis tanakae]|uniref:Uncharacterized protein n=1 Tax=Liparis tanakae TaxID=230148 RepID=A0A4Z2EXU9_9TELE|nr:hypothetical protein EYF80_056395 [Liparis tanakae]